MSPLYNEIVLVLLVAGIGGLVGFVVAWITTSGWGADEGRRDTVPFLEETETVARVSTANRFVETGAVGGRLVLTDRHVWFVPHSATVQADAWSVPLAKVRAVRATRTLGIIPNGVVLELASGTVHRFATWDRDDWVRAVRAALGP
jgi:hypothetical protein